MRPARAWQWWPLALGLVLGVISYEPLRREVGAVRLLLALSAPAPASKEAPSLPKPFSLGEDGRAFRARLYLPEGHVEQCLVLGHGVHWKGIDEPRLVRFAQSLTSVGAAVLTPELSQLADYHITRLGADAIGDAARYLSARCHATGGKVGVVGFSFAGGLSLLAALDPRVAPHLSFVASVGGYQDLGRVLRFFLTDRVSSPTGEKPLKAHEYGFVVLLYDHLESVVPEEDYFVLRGAVRAWLHENRPLAWTLASRRTTAEGEALFLAITKQDTFRYRPMLSGLLDRSAAELAALSPGGRLAEFPGPIYVLHGTGDTVIPPEESLWAEQELAHHPHRVLVTPLLEHVNMSSAPPVADAAKLVQFMAGIL